jgi:DNA (cytosine-5)-methyltransferase 1
MNYYNEHDNFAADWLENLIKTGLIPDGKVDRRSITEVRPNDVRGFAQCHFFAGIGGWSLALQLAGWGPDRPVWTGSCPCQPFSQAGKQKAEKDERHLWPEMYRLIRECQPLTVFGEQVSSAIGHGWLDGVSNDLEAKNYAVGAIVLGAFSVDAPHKRSRLFWVADAASERKNGSRDIAVQKIARFGGNQLAAGGDVDAVGEPDSNRRGGEGRYQRGRQIRGAAKPASCIDSVGNTVIQGSQGQFGDGNNWGESRRIDASQTGSATASGAWTDYRIIHCLDGNSRRVGRSVLPLVNGIPRSLGRGKPELSRLAKRARANRVGRLKGCGNAIVPQVAAQFVMAFMDCKPN